MSALIPLLDVVAPVFFLAAIGVAWVRLGLDYDIVLVTRLTMSLGVPCLIFVSLMHTEIPPAALSTVALAAIAAYAGITLAMLGAVLALRLEVRTYLAPLIFGNTGNLGLPVALFAFGDDGFGYAVAIFAIMAIYSFTVGIWMVSGGGHPARALREPLLWATLAGALFLWRGWTTPTFLTNTLELIGQLAIPLMLITLGVAVARLRPARLLRPLALSLFKALACILVAWGAGRALALSPTAHAVLILQMTTPVAVTSYLLAEKYGADSDTVAGLVVVSTLLYVIMLPLLLAFVI